MFAVLLLGQQPAAAPQEQKAAIAAPAKPAASTLAAVKTIYVLSMRSGLDQFLASALARDGRFEVVTDPELADAILTDRVGKAFEVKYDELYPKAKPAPAEDKSGDAGAADTQGPSAIRTTDPPRVSTLGGGKGTIFLVSRGSRTVLWSTYAKPKSARPDDLNATAKATIHRLADALRKSSGEGGGASRPVTPGN